MISLSIGIGLTRTIGQGGANPITGTGPVLAPLTDGDTLSSAVTWGSYLPPGATADRQMRVDGGAWVAYNGSTVVAEGEVWQVREVVSYSGFTSTFASAAQTVAEAASLFVARFGVGQGSGTGAFNTAYYTSTPPADGTYGPFTVSGGIITPNTTLVAGSYDVGGYPVEVLANWRAFATIAEFAAAGSVGSYGKTCLIREGIRALYDNGASGFLRRTDGAGTIILGDGPDVRLTAHDPAYDARAHFTRFSFRSTRNVTWRNLRFAPTTKITCWEPIEASGGSVTTGNLWVDKCVAIASRPDPNGNYTAGETSFPGNYGFYNSQTVDGLRLTDNIVIGAMRGFRIRPRYWGELVGNASYMSYADAYTLISGDPVVPVLFAANLSALNLARPSDTNNPHSDGLQVLGGDTPAIPATLVIEASAHFSGDCRGRNYTQPFFVSNAGNGYQALMRDCVVSGAEIYPFTISSTVGSRIEHCAWAPSPLDTLPANSTGGIRFGQDTEAVQSGLNVLRNSVFRGLGAGTINAIVSVSGCVETHGWTLANWQAQYEDWTIGGVTYPTLQQVMAGLKSKTGVAGHRVSFAGPDASSFQIAGLVAPTLSSLTVTSTTAASAAATITTDTDLNPVFWAVVPTGTSVAAPRDIKRRLVTGAVLYGWTNLKNGDSAAPIALNLAGALVAGTTYDVVAMQENGWTQVSSVARQTFTAT
ncbi:hypothetical protein [EBPR podovirus 2]|nr:hypothetical protein [EBPR podovirus 2]